jgi:hypothetical protein
MTRRVGILLAVGVLSAAVVPAHAAGTWQTTLQTRDLDGNGSTDAYYDTDLNITWLADSNVFRGSWDAAKTWTDNLVVGEYGDWRLPTLVDVGSVSCSPLNQVGCSQAESASTSELAHLYYVTLGNKSYVDAAGNYDPSGGLRSAGPFTGIQPFSGYWAYAPNTASAWVFSSSDGNQARLPEHFEFNAWAVRSGDVSVVPEPATSATYALGLAGLAVVMVARRRRQS